ncbi:type IV secretory system conjugative DNA transfer family protein [Mycoplasma sp. 125]|uniref:type IV secretory system conjugative DNA transfer family protein n=1 Tax=Mycoplasma sp. 125 TaxID=3447505 RepID=UPI003F65B8F2
MTNKQIKRINKKIAITSFIFLNAGLFLGLFIAYFLYDNYKNLGFAFKNNVLVFMWKAFKSHWWITICCYVGLNLLWLCIFIFLPLLRRKFRLRVNKNTNIWMYNEPKNLGDKHDLKNYVVNKPFEEGHNDKPGWIIKANLKKGYILTENQTLILGGTGAGKSQKIIIPSIYYNMSLNKDKKPNMVITDLKGELTQIFAKPLENHGYDVKVLDLINIKNSMGFNILGSIWDICFRDPNIPDFDSAFKEIDLLVYNLYKWNLSGPDGSWQIGGVEILYNLLCALLLMGYYFKENFTSADFNLNNLFLLLNQNTFVKGAWFNKLFNRGNLIKPARNVKASLSFYIETPSKQLAGYMGFAVQAISPYIKESKLNDLISTNEIRINELFTQHKNKPFCVLIKIPEQDETRNNVILSFISQLYQEAIHFAESKDSKKLDRDLLFLLDEFGNLPPIPAIQTKLSASRGRGIFFACVLQSINQLENKYENAAKTIKDVFNSWIFLGGINNKQTLEEISYLVGKEEINKTSTTTSQNNTSKTISSQEKFGIDTAELQRLPKNQVLILQKQEKALLLEIEFAYKYLKYSLNKGTDHLLNHLKEVEIKCIDFNKFDLNNNIAPDNVDDLIKETMKLEADIKALEKERDDAINDFAKQENISISINDLIKFCEFNWMSVRKFVDLTEQRMFKHFSKKIEMGIPLTLIEQKQLKEFLITKIKPFYFSIKTYSENSNDISNE